MGSTLFPPTETGASLVPTLKVSSVPSHWNAENVRYLEGFASSAGSSISLPTTSTAALSAFDVSGSPLWTKANPAAVIAGYDNWYGFWMDDAAALLYVVLVEVSTTPDTFALVTINAAGTVVTLGTDQPSSDFTAAEFWESGSNMQPDGTGFKLLNAMGTTTAQFAIINATGQFTTDPTALYTNADDGLNSNDPVYESADGFIIGQISRNINTTSASGEVNLEIHNKTTLITTALPAESFRGAGIGGVMRWRDYVVLVGTGTTTRTAVVKSSISDMDTFAKELAEYAGIE